MPWSALLKWRFCHPEIDRSLQKILTTAEVILSLSVFSLSGWRRATNLPFVFSMSCFRIYLDFPTHIATHLPGREISLNNAANLSLFSRAGKWKCQNKSEAQPISAPWSEAYARSKTCGKTNLPASPALAFVSLWNSKQASQRLKLEKSCMSFICSGAR